MQGKDDGLPIYLDTQRPNYDSEATSLRIGYPVKQV